MISLIPVILFSASVFAGIPSTCKKPGMIVLSFDQGPGATTGKVLDILSRRNIPAIFHVSTDHFRNSTWRGYVERASSEGHSVGIFIPGNGSTDGEETESDEFDIELSEKLVRSSNWITSVTGKPPRHVRFGQKIITPNTRRMVETMGLQATRPRIEIRDESNKMDVIWNSINRSFNGTDPSQHSFIIRIRDIMPNLVASLDKFIDYVETKGFRIVPMEACQQIPEKILHYKSAASTIASTKKYSTKATSNHSSRLTNGRNGLYILVFIMTLLITLQ